MSVREGCGLVSWIVDSLRGGGALSIQLTTLLYVTKYSFRSGCLSLCHEERRNGGSVGSSW